ncbi:unnamed protein product [marine sediment metagenome]|uniref:Uncharacterized protein n=1 Tax=marine sediment metagenome TaxID=412755 RepID=X1AH63_9ZZZZ
MLDGSLMVYFCVCEHCGSMTWTNGEWSNALDEDGYLLDENILPQENTTFFCNDCEKPLEPIFFERVNKKERKKIYAMSDKERMNWIKSFRILDELEETP